MRHATDIHTYMLKNICIHQSFTVNGSRRLTEGLQYMNKFFPEICSYIDSVGVDFDEDDNNSIKKKCSHPFHMHDKKCSSNMQSWTAYF